jgi:GDP-D-mannose 3',5'-epimerase
MNKTAVVFGAGGFIGNAMVSRLKSEGYWVRGVDLKYPEFSETEADQFIKGDLRLPHVVEKSLKSLYPNVEERWELYQFAADMGGAGYIFTGEHDADVMHNSVQINLNVCNAIIGRNIKVFYSSSACMYPQDIQHDKDNCGLKESYAYPGNPDSEYGWEKLFSERLYMAYGRNYGLDYRIARFHNIFGPLGTWNNGKEKFPAAICRKVAEAKDGDKIEVWGTGEQTRSFLYIDECIEGVRRLMQSDLKEPVNIGSDEMISVNDLAKMVIGISGKNLSVVNVASNAIGVNARNSDNEMIERELGWRPTEKLKTGMEKLYSWIDKQVNG